MRVNLGNCLLLISILLVGIKVSHCWESYELDLFDLVEEIGQNFYEFLGISQVINFFQNLSVVTQSNY